METELLTTADLATMLRVTPQTVYRWRNFEQGPPFIRIEGSIRYRREDVLAWLDKRTLGA